MKPSDADGGIVLGAFASLIGISIVGGTFGTAVAVSVVMVAMVVVIGYAMLNTILYGPRQNP